MAQRLDRMSISMSATVHLSLGSNLFMTYEIEILRSTKTTVTELLTLIELVSYLYLIIGEWQSIQHIKLEPAKAQE